MKVIQAPVVDGRRVESFFAELRRYAPNYTPDLNLSGEQGAGFALMRIFAQLAETVAVRLDQTPHKHFVAFLDRLGISLLPARAARAAVTFRLASGLEEAVRVPAGTRVTAPGKDDDIPFESTGELIAIPGKLTKAYGADPQNDQIYGPPLDFLKQESRTTTELSYKIQSFVQAKSNRLQLDHTTDLEPGAFILIGSKEKKVIQKKEEGGFVTLSEAVTQDFAEGTIVVPIRNFEVFNGINVQEHSLYLGHSGIFTVKEEVEITVKVGLEGGAAAGLEPLKLLYQFWTKDDDATPPEEEHWENLELKSDGTNGLTTSGEVVLRKPVDREIKPGKVGGTENRWIRAKVEEKLPAGRSLPEIDEITVGVGTTDAVPPALPGIKADQGFYNATPLDLQIAPGIGFFPFGTEPRQFDQFYIASEEAFSKREATVSLDFKLDLQTLAGPSVMVLPPNGPAGQELRVYSIGLRRRLFELDPDARTFKVLGNPVDTPTTQPPDGSRYLPVEDSVPAATSNSLAASVFVFVRTEDALDADPANRAGKLWVHSHRRNGSDPVWVDLDAPPIPVKKTLLFNPAALPLPTGFQAFLIRVYVIGGDRKLYSLDVSNAPAALGGWKSYNSPLEPTCNSSPFVTFAGSTVLVFVTGDDGIVHRLDESPGGAFTWTPLTATTPFKAISRPFAQVTGVGVDAKVFVVGTGTNPDERKLFESDTSDTSALPTFSWLDLGKPPNEITPQDEIAPAGYIEDPANSDLDVEGKHIFLRGADNELWERLDGEVSPGQPRWENRMRPGDPSLRDSPVIQIDGGPSTTTTTINLFSASGRNSLVAWQLEIHRDVSIADPDEMGVLLDENLASDQDGFYKGRSFDTVPPDTSSSAVDEYDGVLKLVRLQSPLSTLTTALDLVINNNLSFGPASAGTDHLIALHNPVPGRVDSAVLDLRFDKVFVDLSDLQFYSRLTGIVALSPLPTPFATFALYAELTLPNTEFLSIEDTSSVPELSWEYWNGRGWLSLAVTDGTRNLLSDGLVTIAQLPSDIESTEVAGQENFWIRARLVGGDYGRETFKITGTPPNQTLVPEKSSLRPPKVRSLRISYTAQPVAPEACLAFNNLDYLDQTAAAQTEGSHFQPFETLEDQSLTLFFGFDKPFQAGPIRMLLDAAERNYDESNPPEFEWNFRKDRKWRKLDVDDGSRALTRQGILTLSASEELTRETRFGQSLFWIKGSLRTDRVQTKDEDEPALPTNPCAEALDQAAELSQASASADPTHPCDESVDQAAAPSKASARVSAATASYPLPLLRGVFPNTVWATHGETITEEIVGSGDGEPDQTHKMQRADVLEGEDIRIRETLSAEEREQIERERGKESVVDREDLGGTWVRWTQVKSLFDCGPEDRCYEIYRATGDLRFGDGTHGDNPPAGVDNIRAFRYRTGGGSIGNLAANKIEALATAVEGIESVFNPTPAGGGSDKADTNQMLTIGPRRISHRDRAVSAEDFEELAYEASREVAKARCLSTTNLRSNNDSPDPCDAGRRHQALAERGWVSLIIVPDSRDPRPCPSLELRRTVRDYLCDRAPSVIAASERIVVRPPDYVTVSIRANIFVTTLENAAKAETQARTTLTNFLHPVHGGPEGKGWEFGRPISKSDIFALIERIPDIDRVEGLSFQFRGESNPDRVEIGPNELPASGEHVLAIKKA